MVIGESQDSYLEGLEQLFYPVFRQIEAVLYVFFGRLRPLCLCPFHPQKICSYVLMSKNIMCLCPNEPQPESYSCLRMLQKQLAIPTAHPISPTTFSTNVKKRPRPSAQMSPPRVRQGSSLRSKPRPLKEPTAMRLHAQNRLLQAQSSMTMFQRPI